MSSRLSANHLLLSAVAKRKASKNPLQAGFTLVELLIVVIIIGILAAVALPGFLNQAEKAREQAAKGAAAAAARACQVTLVTGDPYVAPEGITPDTCTASTAIVYTGADGETATVTLTDGNPSRPVYVAGT